MPSETYEAVENFLKDVDEQISCKIGLDSVNRELRGHIEDKAALYMEYGVEEKEAYRRSVRDMGAADVKCGTDHKISFLFRQTPVRLIYNLLYNIHGLLCYNQIDQRK